MSTTYIPAIVHNRVTFEPCFCDRLIILDISPFELRSCKSVTAFRLASGGQYLAQTGPQTAPGGHWGANRALSMESSLAELERPARGKRASGPGKHRGHRRQPPVPLQFSQGRTPAQKGALALFPWHWEAYPGLELGLFALFKGRAKVDTIRKWRNGDRRTPAWAIDLLSVALEQRRAEIDHALALLAKEKGRD